MKNIANKLMEFCTHKPTLVYSILFILTLVFCLQIPRIQIDTDPENMLDAEHPARFFHNEVKTRFAMHDAIVVGVVNTSDVMGVFTPKTLTDIYDITESIMSIDGVISADLMSISTVDNITQTQPGTIRFEWMMAKAPETDEGSSQIK
jgi:predicted RND superfamily exporter protein